jgi:hypothetical protein
VPPRDPYDRAIGIRRFPVLMLDAECFARAIGPLAQRAKNPQLIHGLDMCQNPSAKLWN